MWVWKATVCPCGTKRDTEDTRSVREVGQGPGTHGDTDFLSGEVPPQSPSQPNLPSNLSSTAAHFSALGYFTMEFPPNDFI